jgi:hypothetical protein
MAQFDLFATKLRFFPENHCGTFRIFALLHIMPQNEKDTNG